MPQPTGRDLHVDQLLSQVSIGYQNASYIAEQCCPEVMVAKQSDLLLKFPKAQWFRNEAVLRAPGTAGARSGYTTDLTTTYFAAEYVMGQNLAQEDIENADDPFTLEADAAAFSTDKVLMKKEKLLAANIFATGKWATDTTPGTLWDVVATSDPLTDIEASIERVRAAIGRRPNAAIVGAKVMSVLRTHPDLIDRIKYTGRDSVTEELLANLIGIAPGNLYVGNAVENTAKEAATATMANIWGKSMLLYYKPETPSKRQPSAMYTYIWSGPNGGRRAVRRYDYLNQRERRIEIEASEYMSVGNVTASDAGDFLSAVVS